MEEEKEVLIVEDSPAQAEHLRRILSKYGYSSFVALNGKEALEILKDHSPKAIISDVIMPELNGFQLCQIVKQNEKTKDITFILLTSLSDPKDIVEGIKVGADGFIMKPYNANYLISTLQYLLSLKELRKTGIIEPSIEFTLFGKRYRLNTSQIQILNLLLSVYEKKFEESLEIKELKNTIDKLSKEITKIKEQESEYDVLIEGIPAPIIVIRKDNEEIISTNSYALSFFNIKKEEIIGKKITDLLSFTPLYFAKFKALLLQNHENKSFNLKGKLISKEEELEIIATYITYKEIPSLQLVIKKG
uniref:Response regulator n=1 Tax=Dictyoglomus thermophilum TaxID=14 RepID=A0A7C3RLL4_DICTH